MAAYLTDVVVNEAQLKVTINQPAVVSAMSQAAAVITAAAATYSGYFTGDLQHSMQHAPHIEPDGITAVDLGSGTEDGDTLWYAAPHWFGVKDPDGLVKDRYYPEWHTHPGVVNAPAHPYEQALKELHIAYTVNTSRLEDKVEP